MGSFTLLDTKIVNALVWTMMHSIWQFSLIALVMSLLIKRYQSSSPVLRYNIALSSLGLSFLVGAITFYYSFENSIIYDSSVNITSTNFSNSSLINIANTNLIGEFFQFIDVYQNSIFLAWMVGFMIFLLKFLISFGYSEFLSKSAKPIFNNKAYRSFRKIYNDFNVKQKIEIGESKYINSPMILGVFRPIILFPIGIINHLDIIETEAILAHELAHFVRKDIYVNTIQNILEVLFYYHPAIWWISANIKFERENCCDDRAIK